MSHAGKNPLEVTLAGNGRSFTLQNPIMTASGTFGFGFEFEPYGDLNVLGGIVVKGLSLEARDGNPMPRIADSPSGMLNCIGLQNPGVKLFLRGLLPRLAEKKAAIIPNLYATTLEEFMVLGHIMTATPPLNAIPAVVAAAPGIVTYTDLPLILPRGVVNAG